jgi:hypothetical protein
MIRYNKFVTGVQQFWEKSYNYLILAGTYGGQLERNISF